MRAIVQVVSVAMLSCSPSIADLVEFLLRAVCLCYFFIVL